MRKPKLLVFQHVPYEPLGTLDPLLKQAGFRLRYVNFGREPAASPKIAGYDGLIVLGGPMNVDDAGNFPHLRTEMEAVARATRCDVPVLGICLGAQILARSEGGAVRPATGSEIGWHRVRRTAEAEGDLLLGDLPQESWMFQWHCDSIVLPAHAIPLATSERCPVQAFRVGEMSWGLQFHMEVDRPLIERWLRVEQNQASLAAHGGAAAADRIRDETVARVQDLQCLANATFANWVRLFSLKPRRRALPSR